MALRNLVLDVWSYLSYKSTFGRTPSATGIGPYTAPGWVPKDEQRRLEAYKMYDAYYRLSAREWMSLFMSDDDRKGRREYGDPYLLTETALSSLLGDKVTIQVEGSILEGGDPASTQQMIFDQWAEDEKFLLKLWECERNACKLGDGVYVVGWDTKKGRPRLSVWDPGFFFPDLNEQHLSVEEFPGVVNIVYEFEKKNRAGEDKKYLRRIQWKLIEVEPYSLPWQAQATENCLMSDGYWLMDNVGDDPFVLDESKANWTIEPTLLQLDFIPVVHIPNFVAGQEFWSIPIVAAVMQLLDDIMATDTDLQKAGALSGTPAVAVSGVSLPANEAGEVLTVGPGQVIETGDGTATVIDTSQGLKALIELKNELLERLSVNGRTPEALLGRVKPNEVPSGIALALGFTQHSNMIREMRMVREEKYRMLFKFVGRMMMLSGELQEYIKTSLVFGSYLPSDKEQTVEQITQLINAKPPMISRETAVNMMIRAGFPIEDATLEVERLIQMDVDTAQKIFDATGDIGAARAWLGLPALENAPDGTEDPNAGVSDQIA
jgi:hypothetical protein